MCFLACMHVRALRACIADFSKPYLIRVLCVTGIGTCIWSNGDTYEGEWQEGFAHGLGTCELCVLLCIYVLYIRGCGFDVGVGVGYVCRYVFAY
jgi:hypothetical protein